MSFQEGQDSGRPDRGVLGSAYILLAGPLKRPIEPIRALAVWAAGVTSVGEQVAVAATTLTVDSGEQTAPDQLDY